MRALWIVLVLACLVLAGCWFGPRHDGYGSCARCERSWAVVEGHTTTYWEKEPITDRPGSEITGWGAFPLCEKCWGSLTPQNRLPYYRAQWEKNWGDSMDGATGEQGNWELIKKAVLEGK